MFTAWQLHPLLVHHNITVTQTEIYFDFTKTTISNIVNDYFTSRRILDENENEKDWFSKVVKGVKLKNAEPNQLLIV